MAQFKLLPKEMKAFNRAKDALPSSCELTSLNNWSCSSCPFPRTWDLRQLQVWESPVALEAELSLTLKVLGTVAASSLGDILDQPLHTLRHIHAKLQACVLAPSTAGSRPQGHLRHWLHHLHEAQRKVSDLCHETTGSPDDGQQLTCPFLSTGFLEASVTFNLFRLLTGDLKCVGSGDLCV
ncbi:LOW QUALITY PROTEIN: interferon lambda-3-like [Rhynchonycteris naso]